MGKKYLLEIEENKDGSFAWSNFAPYVKPDLEQVRKEAYEDGYKTAKVQCNIQAEKDMRDVGERHYQRGLSDAWEAARKIANMPYNEEEKAFGSGGWAFIEKHTASEAIEKIRQYEQEKKEKEEQIQVGDEVNAPFGKAIVVNVDSVAEKIWFLYADGHGGFDFFKNAPTKTGRHFPEIAEALRKMRE